MTNNPLDQLTDLAGEHIRQAHIDGYRLGLGTATAALEATSKAFMDASSDTHAGQCVIGALNGVAEHLRELSARYEANP